MISVNTAIRPDLDLVSSGNKQADAENQKDAWLRQMELNQLTLLEQFKQPEQGSPNNGNAQPGLGSRSGSGSSASPQMSGDNEAVSSQTPVASTSSETSTSGIYPVHPNLVQTGAQTLESNNTDATPDVESSGKAVSSPSALTAALAAKAVPAKPVTTTPTAASDTPLMQSTTSVSVASSPTDSIDSRLAAYSATWASVATVEASEVPGAPVQTVVNSSSSSAASLAFRQQMAGTQERETESAETSEPAKSSPQESNDTASSEEWQKRVMHVSQDGKDISVSIRDNALDARLSSQVVARIASDALQSGLRLRNATVNGKSVLKSSRAQSEVSAVAETENTQSNSYLANQENSHGT